MFPNKLITLILGVIMILELASGIKLKIQKLMPICPTMANTKQLETQHTSIAWKTINPCSTCLSSQVWNQFINCKMIFMIIFLKAIINVLSFNIYRVRMRPFILLVFSGAGWEDVLGLVMAGLVVGVGRAMGGFRGWERDWLLKTQYRMKYH